MIQPKSSRLLSFSVEAARLSDADATPAPAPAPAPRPKSLTRRESPLAAAARRAREAMARKAAPRAKEGPVKEQDGPIKTRESPVKARAKDSPVKTSGKEGPVKAKETKEGPKAKAVPKPAARTTPYAARSLIERPKVESKVLEKKLGKSETSETSAGSTPKCVLLEDCQGSLSQTLVEVGPRMSLLCVVVQCALFFVSTLYYSILISLILFVHSMDHIFRPCQTQMLFTLNIRSQVHISFFFGI